jgi:DNA-binding transcriptional LysR family regulator
MADRLISFYDLVGQQYADKAGMRTEQLEYLAAVARLGSFRRAAEELHLSQPALSESVRKLEGELGVRVLERKRSGTIPTEDGRALLPHLVEVIEAVERLRRAAEGQHRGTRVVRVGTVTAATAPLLSPTIGAFREAHTGTEVEVVTARQEEIHRELRGGGLDIGLVNYLDGDEMPADLETTELLRGQPVVCMHADNPLAAGASVSAAGLLTEPLIGMRSGYVMHRYVARLLDEQVPAFAFTADGAEMGKLMVAEGLGVAVLPDYSVLGDPLEQRGAITVRPIEGDDTGVALVIQRHRAGPEATAVRELHRMFLAHGLDLMARSG